MPFKNLEKQKLYHRKYRADNREKVVDYYKRYNKANTVARQRLINLHRDEYEAILIEEKINQGISPRKLDN